MNIAEALHCAGCGHTLGLEPVALPSALSCPSCKHRLQAFAGTSGALQDCPQCGGQFVENALLKDLLERKQVMGQLVPSALRQSNPLDQPVTYRRCPSCDEHMQRRNFGGKSGIIVDTCYRHGVWFDQGELPRILEWVRAGGLAQARYKKLGLYDPVHPHRDPVARGLERAQALPSREYNGPASGNAGWAAQGTDIVLDLFCALFD